MKINYTNWRGENSDRNIIPLFPYYGSNQWHPEKQWLLKAWDIDKKALRSFAIRDIRPADIFWDFGAWWVDFTWWRHPDFDEFTFKIVENRDRFEPTDVFSSYGFGKFKLFPKVVLSINENSFYWLWFAVNYSTHSSSTFSRIKR